MRRILAWLGFIDPSHFVSDSWLKSYAADGKSFHTIAPHHEA